jgi:hypothetical protein
MADLRIAFIIAAPSLSGEPGAAALIGATPSGSMSDTLILDDFDQLGIPAANAALAVAIYTKLQEHCRGHN